MAHAAKTRRDDPEDRILFRAVAELRVTFTRRGLAEPFPFFHTPNEGAFSKWQAVLRQQRGVTAGVGDLVIVTPLFPFGGDGSSAVPYPGAALEIKAVGKKPTPEQLAWLEYWRAAGFAADWTAGHHATADRLLSWGLIAQDQFDRWIVWAERNDAGNL